MTEEFENEKTGERVEGITIMVDGVIKELFDIIKREKKEYSLSLIHISEPTRP